MSSRNIYLGESERIDALALSKALVGARSVFDAGERDCRKIMATVKSVLEAHPLVSIDYAEIRDAETLLPVERVERRAVVALAVRVGKARLIDNTVLEP
jgi:pantoate--beta-alanine ligase